MAGEKVLWLLGRHTASRCEWCGRRAEVELADGSTWCLSCDASAESLGYDAPEAAS